MKISPLFAWYDLWIGAFWDRKNRVLYILPVPCFGFKVEFGRKPFYASTHKWAWYKGEQIVVDSIAMEVAVHHENNALIRPYRAHVRGLAMSDCPGCLWMLTNLDPDKYALANPPSS